MSTPFLKTANEAGEGSSEQQTSGTAEFLCPVVRTKGGCNESSSRGGRVGRRSVEGETKEREGGEEARAIYRARKKVRYAVRGRQYLIEERRR